jgi:hypothetical protein
MHAAQRPVIGEVAAVGNVIAGRRRPVDAVEVRSICLTARSSVDETTTLYEPPLIVVPSPGLGKYDVGAVVSEEYTL